MPMNNHTNDIDDLMCWLSRPPRHDWDERPAEQDRYYLALAALVAERDSLRAELAAMRHSDDCEMTALECQVRCKALSAERDELKRQVAEAWRLYLVELFRRRDSEERNFAPEWGAEYLGRDCFAQKEGGGA
jgi:hypothetical protein